MINDLTGKPCKILRTVKDIEKLSLGIVPISDLVEVENEDGTVEFLYPWEISDERR